MDTAAGPYKNYTVVFLGSDNGHVLKVLASTEGPNASFSTLLLEDIDVYNPDKSDISPSHNCSYRLFFPPSSWLPPPPPPPLRSLRRAAPAHSPLYCCSLRHPAQPQGDALYCSFLRSLRVKSRLLPLIFLRCDVRGEDRRVLGLELDRDHHALFVAFSSCVIRVPLSRCSDYSTCRK